MSTPEPVALSWKPVPRPGPITLRGRYVTLEPLDPQWHSGHLWEAASGHDDLWTWLADGPYCSEPELRRSLAEKQASTNAVFLAIVPAETDRAAGYASYMRMEPEHGVVEVGNILMTPALQRTTAATEAMYLMACHVFDHLGYRRYEWKCNARNGPSRRAAERYGFTFEGIFRKHMVVKDRSRDTAWFSMLDCEWPGCKKALETWLEPGNFDEAGQQKRTLTEIRADSVSRQKATLAE